MNRLHPPPAVPYESSPELFGTNTQLHCSSGAGAHTTANGLHRCFHALKRSLAPLVIGFVTCHMTKCEHGWRSSTPTTPTQSQTHHRPDDVPHPTRDCSTPVPYTATTDPPAITVTTPFFPY